MKSPTEPTENMENNGRGRPIVATTDQRRARILAVAEAAFAERGYHHVSMERIARDCGMSKRTLYDIYPDKEHVFEDVLALKAQFPEILLPEGLAPPQELCEVLVQAASFALGGEQMSMLRLVISEAKALPEITSHHYQSGLEKIVGLVAERLRDYRERGLIAQSDCDLLADILVGATVGPGIIRNLVDAGQNPDLDADKVRERAGQVINLMRIFT